MLSILRGENFFHAYTFPILCSMNNEDTGFITERLEQMGVRTLQLWTNHVSILQFAIFQFLSSYREHQMNTDLRLTYQPPPYKPRASPA